MIAAADGRQFPTEWFIVQSNSYAIYGIPDI